MTGIAFNEMSAAIQGMTGIQQVTPTLAKANASDDFQAILSKQTGAAKSAEEPLKAKEGLGQGKDSNSTSQGAEETKTTAGTVSKGEQVKEQPTAKHLQEKTVSVEQKQETAAEPEEQEIPEEVMEVLQGAIAQVLEAVMETFGVSEGEVEEALEALALSGADLLDADKLSSVLTRVSGEQDSLALITDENLYQNFQTVAGKQQEVLAETAEQLQVAPEQVADLAARMEEQVADAEDRGPVITIETETETVDEVPMQNQLKTEARATETVEEKAYQKEKGVSAPKSKETVNAAEQAKPEAVVPRKASAGRQMAGHHGAGAEHSGSFLQEFRMERFGLMTEQATAAAESVFDMDTQNIMRQIMDYMRIQLKPDMSTLEMQLHPASLGNVQVQLSSKGGAVTAQFIAQNETVKAVLESQMIELKETFERQGVKVNAIEVSVQTNEFERNLEQEGRRQGEGSEKKNRTRRIQLDGELRPDALGEMDEEDRLTADMMAANGNSVDYTA